MEAKKEYFKAKLKIFELQNKNQYALINNLLKVSVRNRNFLSKSIFPKNKKL